MYEVNENLEVTQTLEGGLKRRIELYGFSCGINTADKLNLENDMVQFKVSACMLNPDGTESVDGYKCGTGLDFQVPLKELVAMEGNIVINIHKVFADHFLAMNPAPADTAEPQ